MATFNAVSTKKAITLELMKEFIVDNCPEDREWFMEVAFQDKEGNKTNSYNHFNAVGEFCKRYATHLLEKKKAKKDPFADWKKELKKND